MVYLIENLIRRATSRGRGFGVRSPLPFFENRKKMCHDFAKIVHWLGKKCPVCVHLWVKFSFKVELRVSRSLNTNYFPCFLLYFIDEIFIELSLFQGTSRVSKIFWFCICLYKVSINFAAFGEVLLPKSLPKLAKPNFCSRKNIIFLSS